MLFNPWSCEEGGLRGAIPCLPVLRPSTPGKLEGQQPYQPKQLRKLSCLVSCSVKRMGVFSLFEVVLRNCPQNTWPSHQPPLETQPRGIYLPAKNP